jgi:hypothetical protein
MRFSVHPLPEIEPENHAVALLVGPGQATFQVFKDLVQKNSESDCFLAAVSLFPRPRGRDIAYSFAGAWTIPVTGEIRSPQLQIGQTTSSAV